MINKDFKISVIVPVHNSEEFVIDTLQSIKDQTYTKFEVIVVDDGSTDDSKRVIRKWIKDDKRFKLYHFSHNCGVSEARNFGIQIAQGDIVCFIDSDDKFTSKAFEKIAKEFKSQSPDVLVFGADVVCDGEPPEWLVNCLTPADHITYYGAGNIDLIFKAKVRPFSWRVAIDRRLLNKYPTLAYDADLTLGEDQVFLFELYLQSSKTLLIADHLYKYNYKREDSATVKHQSDWDLLEHHAKIVKKVASLYFVRKSRLSITDYDQLHQWINRFSLSRLHDAIDEELPNLEHSNVIANSAYTLATTYKYLADCIQRFPPIGSGDVFEIRSVILVDMSECFNVAAEYGRRYA